jgi:hydroxymethylglutaryl-CoA lyase
MLSLSRVKIMSVENVPVKKRVEIVDVALRDGLQNERRYISTNQKLVLLEKLVYAGISSIQVGSFVNPKLVPRMADIETLAKHLGKYPGVNFCALILNTRGFERALEAGFRHMEFVLAVSETFNLRNANRSVAESLKYLEEISPVATLEGAVIRVGLATSFHCPFEGRTPVSAVVDRARQVRNIGPWRMVLGDTDGMCFPDQVKAAAAALRDEAAVQPGDVVLHFHDTYGRALANALAGIAAGIRTFDGAAGGLGGCPFCPGASGNVATEDLVTFFEGLGYVTGIDMERLLDAAEISLSYSSRPYEGHILRATRPTAVRMASASCGTDSTV